MRNLILWSFIGAMLLSCENRVPELKIVREKKVEELPEEPVVLTADDKWTKLENGLYGAEFDVPPTFTYSSGGVDDSTGDPFAVTVTPIRTRTAKSILEGAGITFGKGTSATYDARRSKLIVEQTVDQMELIEAFVTPLDGYGTWEKEVHIRVEIYELSSAQVLQLMESAQSEGDHRPERNAALKAVRKGKGKLVASPSILCRSGQRSKTDSSEQLSFFLNHEKDAGEGGEDMIVGGTTLEVDVVLGADEYTIDLNIGVVHYAGPAAELTKENPEKSNRLLLHRKSILTQVTLKDGNYILIGDWKPTGAPRFEENDLSHVVFVTASIQRREGPQ